MAQDVDIDSPHMWHWYGFYLEWPKMCIIILHIYDIDMASHWNGLRYGYWFSTCDIDMAYHWNGPQSDINSLHMWHWYGFSLKWPKMWILILHICDIDMASHSNGLRCGYWFSTCVTFIWLITQMAQDVDIDPAHLWHWYGFPLEWP